MKKVLTLFVVLLLSLTLVACSSSEPSGTLVVGTPKLNGDFIEGFGNSSYDKYVKDILWDYGTYAVSPEGVIDVNKTVVKEVESKLDADGNKVYTFKLNSGLKWSDGKPVTAKDYVFSLLWTESPAWLQAGASSNVGEGLLGYGEYHGTIIDPKTPNKLNPDGTEQVDKEGEKIPNYLPAVSNFSGVKYVDESTFSLTISAKKIPYFYETVYVTAVPYPMHVWAPNVDIAADGSSLSASAAELAELAKTVAAKERFNPSVVSGSYKFTSFENQIVTLDVNEHYAGNPEGEKGKLEQVIVKYINQDTDVDQVINGEVDLITGVIEGQKIEKAKKASSTTKTNSYKRNGYGMIAFANDFGPTADYRVREALGYTIDRQQFTSQILQGYGTIVNGEYGLSQWMYQKNEDAVKSQLINYTLNTAKANEILDQTEWKFDSTGAAFDATKAGEKTEYYRYNDKGQVLQINHLGTTENAVTDLISTIWPKGLAEAGVKFTIEFQDFNALLTNYYYGYSLGKERKFHSFNLATGFTAVYDPYTGSYHSDFYGTWQNPTQTKDAELDKLIEEMRRLDPSETDKYAEIWLKYQIRWNEILPVLPIYSNEYFDVYSNKVEGLVTTPVYTWANGIAKVTKGS